MRGQYVRVASALQVVANVAHLTGWLHVATMHDMVNSVGIRELKNSLSRFIRRVEAGESFDVTDRGRIVARLVPNFEYGDRKMNRLDKLIAEGLVAPAAQDRSAIKWPKQPLVALGVSAALIDEDRGE